MRSSLGLVVALALGAPLSSCSSRGDNPLGDTQTFRVRVLSVNGLEPPTQGNPLPTNTGTTNESWEVEIEAVGPDGNAVAFDGFVRLSVQPGAVVEVVNGEDGENIGKSLRLRDGKANAVVLVTAVYGPARLWVEDLGYTKAPEGETPACANGQNDDPDDDVLVDFPSDPGCAFADDHSETAGTFSAGVSAPIAYDLPTIQDIQGNGSTTPFPFESMTVNAEGLHHLVVTRVSKDGFYVTDLSGQDAGFNHLFAFNFSTPAGMRVCDRVTYLSGTISEFFGFTEMNFPSYEVDPLFEGEEEQCQVPEPEVLEPDVIDTPLLMERLESGLVRIEGYHVSNNIGPKLALNNVFAPDQTNCDLNGDGKVDFEAEAEASCGNACSDDPECSEWTGFVARGNYKVSKQAMDAMGNPVTSVIQVQTDGAPEFSPVANRGLELTAVTGSLRNFSGGSLNWTVESRCPADVVCEALGCAPEVTSSQQACVSLRTEDDNDEGTN